MVGGLMPTRASNSIRNSTSGQDLQSMHTFKTEDTQKNTYSPMKSVTSSDDDPLKTTTFSLLYFYFFKLWFLLHFVCHISFQILMLTSPSNESARTGHVVCFRFRLPIFRVSVQLFLTDRNRRARWSIADCASQTSANDSAPPASCPPPPPPPSL